MDSHGRCHGGTRGSRKGNTLVSLQKANVCKLFTRVRFTSVTPSVRVHAIRTVQTELKSTVSYWSRTLSLFSIPLVCSIKSTVFLEYLQALQVGHLVFFYLFAEYFSWSNYVSFFIQILWSMYLCTSMRDINVYLVTTSRGNGFVDLLSDCFNHSS